MVATLQKSDKKQSKLKQKFVEPSIDLENDYLSTLETLRAEERSLLTEKSQLIDMEKTLRQKIKVEIEMKRRRIEALKNEIPELQRQCELLAKALDITVRK